MMRSVAILCLAALSCIGLSHCDDREERIVRIPQGPVRGYKESDDVFAFYGIPYATAPTGRDRFKAPYPAPSWLSTLEAVNRDISCPQVVVPELIGHNAMLQEDCLIVNIFVPDTNETNLPVAVYVHGGGFQIGNGIFFKAKKMLQRKNFIMVTFNYRLGPHGFLCLGTDGAPGNAGAKDQVALLKWVNKNIAEFGGNPNDVTIWGSSAGSAAVDLLMLSPMAEGLFHKVIPDSGANLAAFTVQTDPIANAKEFARQLNFSDVDNLNALEEFYLTASFETLFKFVYADRKDSVFIFSPCVESKTNEAPFLEESPYDILKSGNYIKVPILYGFSNMEGIMRLGFFDDWKVSMNEKFSDFLPPDLEFKNDEEREKVATEIKEFYFGDGAVSDGHVMAYIDYFSDVIFTYPALRAINLHVEGGHDEIYLYEYSYVNEVDNVNSPLIPHTNNVRGANHCAQSAAVFDGVGMSPLSEDELPQEYQNVKALVREMWNNFITTGSPVPKGSPLPQWPAVGADNSPHMSIGAELQLRGPLLEKRRRFWDSIYERYYRAPQPPAQPSSRRNEL